MTWWSATAEDCEPLIMLRRLEFGVTPEDLVEMGNAATDVWLAVCAARALSVPFLTDHDAVLNTEIIFTHEARGGRAARPRLPSERTKD